MRRRHLLLLAGVLAVTAGCTSPGAPTSSSATPTETTPSVSAAALTSTGLVAAEPLRSTFSGLTSDGLGALWWTGPGVTRYDPPTGALRTFTVADDAAFGDVRDLAPSRSGGVWLVTSTALLRFDGQRFEHVVTTPAAMLEVAEAPDGTVWAAADDTTGAGVWSWNGSVWRRLPGGRPGSAVYPLTVDAAGHVWVGDIDYPGPVGRGVSVWNGRSWTTYSPAEIPMSGAYVLRMTATPDGAVWLGGDTPGTAARFAGGRWTGFTEEQTGMGSIQSIAQAPDGAVWFGGAQSNADGTPVPPGAVLAARFDRSGWTRYDAMTGLTAAGDSPSAEVTTTGSTVWAGTDRGLYRFAGSSWRLSLANPPGPVSPGRAVVARSVGDVWTVDRMTGQLWHYSTAGWSTPARTGRLAGHVTTAALGVGGNLWVGTDTGLTRLDATGWTDAGPAVPISGVAVGPDGTVWAGSSQKLMHLDGARVLATFDSPDRGMETLAVGPDGDVWATGFGYTEGVGPKRLHDGAMETTTPISGRSDVTATWVTVAPDGGVWASLLIPVAGASDRTDAALARYDGRTWTVHRDLGLGSWDRPQLSAGPDGTVYAASSWGLFGFDGSSWTKRLPGHWVAASAAADGTLWLTSDAVYRLPPPSSD
jgi:ligand-binding sensor domain-containing protein